MTYVLDSNDEFERLEKQSQTDAYDFRVELSDIVDSLRSKKVSRILDAGCGSGIVSRYLADAFAGADVKGCDVSDQRIEQASKASAGVSNISFDQANLESLPYPSNHFDLVVCRYVMQHMRPAKRKLAMRELHRCLRPGGTLRIVDMDGAFFNLYPISKGIAEPLRALFDGKSVDLNVASKLPTELRGAGFKSIDWDIQVLNFRGALLETEIRLNTERFGQMQDYFASVLGTEGAARTFTRKFIEAMNKPDAVFFYNKFLITASKGLPELVKG